MSTKLASTDFDELKKSFSTALSKALSGGVETLFGLEKEWLGKEGIVKKLFSQLRDVEGEAKPAIASKLNALKEFVESELKGAKDQQESQTLIQKLKQEFLDPSLPGRFVGLGRIHPVTRIERQISDILKPFGFNNVLGPEVETEYYCFDSLNIPPHHPARDMQDTFYTDSGHVLRTHTTSVQARSLEEGGLPIKVASFGKVYRNETEDASHQAMFHQFELVWIEQGLTLSHLMGIISHILKSLYGKRRKVRFVPKFYPYTEPSIGPQIQCGLCSGKGCPACGGAGWVTIGGAGMVHRKVLEEFKYEPSKVSGFAFGLGTSRLASQMFDVPKLKTLYDNDLRVLRQV